MDEISFEELRKVHLQEKHTPTLFQLNEDFYDIYLNYMEKFYSELKGDFSIQSAKTFENCKSVFLELTRLRCQKIILKAFKDSKVNAYSTEGLTRQEKILYVSMIKTFTNYDSIYSGPKQAKPDNVVEVKLEILTDLPELVSPTGKTFGPFSKNSVIEVDEEIAKLLIEKNAARVV